MKILLIEDDPMLVNGLSKALTKEGYAIESSVNGSRGIELVSQFQPEIVILDLGLPDIDGIQVLRAIRQTANKLPVLILTARESMTDKVTALDFGADDYLAKPFDMPELLARIRVLARRLGTSNTNELQIGSVRMDVAAHKVWVEDCAIELTRREFMVLKALMENAGRIQTKDMIEGKLYGWGEAIGSNTVEVHISNLRKKLPALFIKTVRGVGYTVENTSH